MIRQACFLWVTVLKLVHGDFSDAIECDRCINVKQSHWQPIERRSVRDLAPMKHFRARLRASSLVEQVVPSHCVRIASIDIMWTARSIKNVAATGRCLCTVVMWR